MTELTEAELDDWQAEAEKSPGQSFYVATDFMLRLIAAARASLSPWRSIESAPKDGTAIIMWNGYRAFVGIWKIAYAGKSHWSFDGDEPSIKPTHWMPLPPAPHSNGERDDETQRIFQHGRRSGGASLPVAGD